MDPPTLPDLPFEIIGIIAAYVTSRPSSQSLRDLGNFRAACRQLSVAIGPDWIAHQDINLTSRSALNFFQTIFQFPVSAARVAAVRLPVLRRAPAVGTWNEWERILLLSTVLQQDDRRRQILVRRLANPANHPAAGQLRADTLLLLAFEFLPRLRQLSLAANGGFASSFLGEIRRVCPDPALTTIRFLPGAELSWAPLVLDDFWLFWQLPRVRHAAIIRLELRAIHHLPTSLPPLASLNVFSRNGADGLRPILGRCGGQLTFAALRDGDRTPENWHRLVEGLRHHAQTLGELRLRSRERLHSRQQPHPFAPGDPAWATHFSALTDLEVPIVAVDPRFGDLPLGALLPPRLEYLRIFCPASVWAPCLRTLAEAARRPSSLRAVEIQCRRAEDMIAYEVLVSIFDAAGIALGVAVRDW